jgi:deoxyribodipyrimidine photo-lyase
VRMYNPVKQGHDQDPRGVFVRRWVPELAELPDHAIHEPWGFPELRAGPAAAYPERIVDHVAAAKVARAAVWSVRGSRAFGDAAAGIQERHGSRKSGMAPTGRTKRQPRSSATVKGRNGPKPQLEFDL